MKKTKFHGCLVGLGLLLAACSGNRGTGTGNSPIARTQDGGVVQGLGPNPISTQANTKFEEAARMMRQHDEANDAKGDWTEALCNEVASKFEGAANEQANGAFPEAWLNRALVFDRCGKTNEAKQSLERALAVAPQGNFCRARVQLGVFQYRENHKDEARATFEQAIRADANCVEGYTNLAMMLRERNQPAANATAQSDHQLAVNNIRQALARDDRFIPALNQLALTYLEEAGDDPRSQRLMLAGIVCQQAAGVVARSAAEAADSGVNPLAPEVRAAIADVYNTWGVIDIRRNEIIQALNHFSKAFQTNPNMFEALVNYGTINLSFRGYADAKEAFQRAVQLRNNDYDAHIGLGVALRGLEQYDQAQAEYEAAQRLDGNRPDSYYNLGVLYESYKSGQVPDLDQAQRYLEQFINKAGQDPRYADAVERARRHIRNLIDTKNALAALAALGGNDAGTAPPPSTPPAGTGDGGTP